MGDDVTSAALVVSCAAGHAYFAVVLALLARVTRTPGAQLAWLPIGNLVLLARIAGRPPAFVVLLLVPVANVWAGVVLWMAVASRTGRTPVHGLLVLVPLIGPLVPLWWGLQPGPADAAAPAYGPCPEASRFCAECGAQFGCSEAYCGDCGAARQSSSAAPPVAAARNPGVARMGAGPLLGVTALVLAVGAGAWRLAGPALDALTQGPARPAATPTTGGRPDDHTPAPADVGHGLPPSSSASPRHAPAVSAGRRDPASAVSGRPATTSRARPQSSTVQTPPHVAPPRDSTPPGSFHSERAVVVQVESVKAGPEAQAQDAFLSAVSAADHGRWVEAEKELARAVSLHPGSGKYRAEHAATLLRTGRRDEAADEAQAAQHLGFTDHWVFRELGMAE